jgi:hypothetical protein
MSVSRTSRKTPPQPVALGDPMRARKAGRDAFVLSCKRGTATRCERIKTPDRTQRAQRRCESLGALGFEGPAAPIITVKAGRARGPRNLVKAGLGDGLIWSGE